MGLHFRLLATPSSQGDLSEPERQQVRLAGRIHDGSDRPAEERLRVRSGEGALERWEIVDDGGLVRYQVWLLGGDSGTVFFAGEARPVGHVVQFGFTSDEHPDAWAEIASAADPPEMIDFSNDPI